MAHAYDPDDLDPDAKLLRNLVKHGSLTEN